MNSENLSTSSIVQNVRFAATTREEMSKSLIEAKSKSTISKSKWAMSMFQNWFNQWKIRLDDVPKVLKDIEEFTPSDLNHCLQYFFCDMRKTDKDRSMYPPQTQKEICAAIQYHFNDTMNWQISIFKDKDFTESRKVLDAQMKKAARLGLVQQKKRASIITINDEELLWNNGSFGWANPRQLINTLIYFIGLHFSLRAGEEHRNLVYGESSQIKLLCDNDGNEYLEYTEHFSKNKTFGLKNCRMDPKCTRVYARENKEKCPIEIYKRYISHRPESNGKNGHSAFYLAIIDNPATNVWYKASPIGVHSIRDVTKRLLKSLNPSEFYTNTSLRRTAQTRLTEANIAPAVISKKTGRISTAATSAYVDSAVFEKRMSTVLHGESESTKTLIVNTERIEINPPEKKMRVEIDGEKNKIIITFD